MSSCCTMFYSADMLLTQIKGKCDTITPYDKQNSLTPYENNNMNFCLAYEQVIYLETRANLWAHKQQA